MAREVLCRALRGVLLVRPSHQALELLPQPAKAAVMQRLEHKLYICGRLFLRYAASHDTNSCHPHFDAQAEPCESVVRSVEFHSNGQLLLVAGLDKRWVWAGCGPQAGCTGCGDSAGGWVLLTHRWCVISFQACTAGITSSGYFHPTPTQPPQTPSPHVQKHAPPPLAALPPAAGCGFSTWTAWRTPRCRACTCRTCRCTRRRLRGAARRRVASAGRRAAARAHRGRGQAGVWEAVQMHASWVCPGCGAG